MRAAVLADSGRLEVAGRPRARARRLGAGRDAGRRASAAPSCTSWTRCSIPPFFPFVLGHEAAGVVEHAPPGSDLAPGDRVAVYNIVGCGACHWCRTGRDELCARPAGQLGFSLDGGFADLVRAPAENLIRLPDTVSFETGAILACSGMTAVHAVRLADVRLGETAIVNGVGGVGLMVIQVAAIAGARVIAVADSPGQGGPRPRRRRGRASSSSRAAPGTRRCPSGSGSSPAAWAPTTTSSWSGARRRCWPASARWAAPGRAPSSATRATS